MATGWSNGNNSPINIFSFRMSWVCVSLTQSWQCSRCIKPPENYQTPLFDLKFRALRRWFSGWKLTNLASWVQVLRTYVKFRRRGKCLDSWQSYSEVLVRDGRIPEQLTDRSSSLGCEKQPQTRYKAGTDSQVCPLLFIQCAHHTIHTPHTHRTLHRHHTHVTYIYYTYTSHTYTHTLHIHHTHIHYIHPPTHTHTGLVGFVNSHKPRIIWEEEILIE